MTAQELAFIVIISLLAGVAVTAAVFALLSRSHKDDDANGPTPAERISTNELALRQFRERLANAPLLEKFSAFAFFFGALLNGTTLGEDLVKAYNLAGRPRDLSDDALSGYVLYPMLVVTLGGGILAMAFIPPLLFAAPVLGFCIGFFLVKTWVSGQRKEQVQCVSETLPYVIDSLVAAMRAGASFIMATEITAQAYENTPVGKELFGIIKHIRQGMSTSEAARDFKERFPTLPVVDSFADDVINSARYGTPLAEVLEQSSERYKQLRIQTARETAGKAKVQILAPGVVILFGSLLLLFGPFAVKFLTMQKNQFEQRAVELNKK